MAEKAEEVKAEGDDKGEVKKKGCCELYEACIIFVAKVWKLQYLYIRFSVDLQDNSMDCLDY